MNQKQLLFLGENTLSTYLIQEPHLKARKLLEHTLKQNTQQLVINSSEEVGKEKQKQYEENLQKLIQGVPLQYITNKQEFMGLCFYVDKQVLIPQPDTEVLVETAIRLVKQTMRKEQIPYLLDLCTGSGAIGISMAKYLPNANIVASDISKEAIRIAQKNAMENQVQNQLQFVCSNLFENIQGQFDFIISNPPYIPTDDILVLSKEVQNEPHIALDGGIDGLRFYHAILQDSAAFLKTNGYLLIEIGYNQANQIRNLWETRKTNFKLITKKPIKDLGNNDRVLIFQKVSSN